MCAHPEMQRLFWAELRAEIAKNRRAREAAKARGKKAFDAWRPVAVALGACLVLIAIW